MDEIKSPAWRVRVCAALILFYLGLLAGAYLAKPAQPVETPLPAELQADGSLLIERKPDASAKPAVLIPKGAKVERIVQIKAKPKPKPAASQPAQSIAPADCPPVLLDMALVRLPDQTRRVIAKAEDGEILAAIDTPIETANTPAPRPWALGVSYDDQKRLGIWLDRDLWRTRVGLAVRQSDLGLRGEVRLGWRF